MNDDYTLDQYFGDRVWEPSYDNRTWKSNVYDINGGDNFADFCEEFFEMLDENDYWES